MLNERTLLLSLSLADEDLKKADEKSERLKAKLSRLREVERERDERIRNLLAALREMETCRDEAKTMLEFLYANVDWSKTDLRGSQIELIPVAIERSRTAEEKAAGPEPREDAR